MSGTQQGPPPWVTAAGGPPPAAIASLFSGSMSFGPNGPPSSILAQISSLAGAASTSMTGSPTAHGTPSVPTGPPAGFSIPPGATGPPPGFSIPAGATGLPAGFNFPGSGHGPPPGTRALDASQSRTLVGATVLLLVLTFAAVGARLLARRVARMRIEADDWASTVAFFMFLALCIDQLLMGHYGQEMGKTHGPPNPITLRKFSQLQFASEMNYTIVTCFAKVTVLMLYRRIFSMRTKWFRIMWYINAAVIAIYFIVMLCLQTTTCKPVSKIWNSPGSCRPEIDQMGALGFVNAAIDLAVLLLPIRMVWSLQLNRNRKIAVSTVFGLGLLGVVTSIARAATIIGPGLFDEGGLTLMLWSTAEPAVAIICSCLPVLRPLYTHGVAKLGSRGPWSWYASKKSRSYGPSGGSGGSASKEQNNTNLTGTTLRSNLTEKNQDEKSWLKTTDTEVGFQAIYEPRDTPSPISPLDKPLPPAYAPTQEADTGYHTWTWNLLSRPRDEHKAPTLTRSTIIQETGSPWRASTFAPHKKQKRQHLASIIARKTSTTSPPPPRANPSVPISDRSMSPTSHSNTLLGSDTRTKHEPNGSTSTIGFRSLSPSSISEAIHNRFTSNDDSRTSPSIPAPAPGRRFFLSNKDIRRPLKAETSTSSSDRPSRPKPVARLESNSSHSLLDRSAIPPKLSIRTPSAGASASTSEGQQQQTTTTQHTHPALRRSPSGSPHVSDLAISTRAHSNSKPNNPSHKTASKQPEESVQSSLPPTTTTTTTASNTALPSTEVQNAIHAAAAVGLDPTAANNNRNAVEKTSKHEVWSPASIHAGPPQGWQ